MRVFRAPLSRLPRAVRVALFCLPGLAAVIALVLWAVGADWTPAGAGRPATARATAAHRAERPPIRPRERWRRDAAYPRPPARYPDRALAVSVPPPDPPNA